MNQVISIQDTLQFHDLVQDIVDVLRDDGVILMPSDTCYGFTGNAYSQKAHDKICYLKDMPNDKPISVSVDSLDTMFNIGDFDEYAREIAVQFLPGKLTLIVDSSVDSLPASVGIRLPDHQLMREVSASFGGPIFTTSANAHGGSNPYAIEHVEEQLGEKFKEIDLVVDAGVLEIVDPSTVVKILDHKIEILREGDLASLLFEQFG